MVLLYYIGLAILIHAAVGETIVSAENELIGSEWKFSAMGSKARAVTNKILSVEQAEGVGARVRRSVGGAKVSTKLSFLKERVRAQD